jgi:hypothetical protein
MCCDTIKKIPPSYANASTAVASVIARLPSIALSRQGRRN